MSIHFGTDGWRAVISDTFTFGNLRLVSQAIADAVSSTDWLNGAAEATGADPRAMVVGFDTRFLSDRYASEVARVLAGNGFTVQLTHSDAPTPAVSFAVKHQRAAGAVMITASHNAPRYNGVKLKGAYGGSALPEQCRRVEIYLNDNEARARGPNLMDFEQASAAGLIRRFNPAPAYYDHLRTLISLDTIASHPDRLRVVVDSMYGSGRGYIKGFLQGTGCEVVEIRGEMNPGFGGVHPEPIARYLQPTAAAIAAGHGDLGIVTDGDADRIGAMDGKGNFVDPHKIFALALHYLVEKRGWRGAVVRTVSTTRMIDRLAARYGLPLIETPVGFNHIADHILAGDVLIGGEESGGIAFKGHIPEGDGILMGLLLLEIVAESRATLHELVDDLLKDVGPAFYARKDLRLQRPVAKAEMTRRLAEDAPADIDGLQVVQVETRDGVKYIMADDSWLLIRPSGTEPVLRVYAEARDEKMVAALLGFGQKVAEGVSEENAAIGPLGLWVGQMATRSKTVTEADLRAYAEITGDYNPLHFDDDFAAATRFGRRVAQGGVTAGMLNALVAMDLPGAGTVFMSQSLTYKAPAYVGDTLTGRVEVVSLKPDKPVCQLKFEVTNQDGTVLLEAEAWTYTLRPDLERR